MPRATAWPPGVHPSGFSPSLVVLHIHSRLHLMSTLMAAIYHGVTLAFRLPRNVYLWHPAIHHEGAPLGRHPFPGLSLSPEVLARFSCLALPPQHRLAPAAFPILAASTKRGSVLVDDSDSPSSRLGATCYHANLFSVAFPAKHRSARTMHVTVA